MSNINAGWEAVNTGVECSDGQGISWQTFTEFLHADSGRVVVHVTTFQLFGQVTLYGDPVGFEPFADSVDDVYAVEVERLTADGEFTREDVERELGRSFFLADMSEYYEVMDPHTETWECSELSDTNGRHMVDLDYTGAWEHLKDKNITAPLERIARREAEATLSFTDLDHVYAGV